MGDVVGIRRNVVISKGFAIKPRRGYQAPPVDENTILLTPRQVRAVVEMSKRGLRVAHWKK